MSCPDDHTVFETTADGPILRQRLCFTCGTWDVQLAAPMEKIFFSVNYAPDEPKMPEPA